MVSYEFSLKQEVLMEKGAEVQGRLMNHMVKNGLSPDDLKNPYVALQDAVWKAKHDILLSSKEEELIRIDAQFDFADKVCDILEVE